MRRSLSASARATRRAFLGTIGLGSAGVLLACATPTRAPTGADAPASSPSAPPAPAPANVTASPAPLTSLRYSLTSRTAGNWPDFVATRKGLWVANGLEPDTMIAGTTVVSVQAIASGSIDVGYITADSAIAAVDKGANLVAVYGGQNLPVYSLVVPPGIASFEQLRGKALGVSALSSGDAFFVHRMLERAGLRYPDDYDVIPAGGTPERFAALKSGAIAGALLIQPFDARILKEGFRRLALSTDAVRWYAWTSLWTRRSWAQANEDTLVRVVRTLRQAHQWLYDPQNKEEAIEILVAELQAEADEARDGYEILIEQTRSFSREGEIPEEAMQVPIDFLAARGDLSMPPPAPGKFIDLSYLRKAGAAV